MGGRHVPLAEAVSETRRLEQSRLHRGVERDFRAGRRQRRTRHGANQALREPLDVDAGAHQWPELRRRLEEAEQKVRVDDGGPTMLRHGHARVKKCQPRRFGEAVKREILIHTRYVRLTRREVPRLCRGGRSSLTFSAVGSSSYRPVRTCVRAIHWRRGDRPEALTWWREMTDGDPTD